MEEKEKDTVKEGVGLFDFEQLMGGDSKSPDTMENEGEDLFDEFPKDDVKEDFDIDGESPKEDEASVEEEPKEKEKKTSEEKEPRDKVNYFSNIAKKYIESGFWEDRAILVDDKEIAISDLDDLDEETFLQITEAQENLKKSNLIDLSDLDDTTKDIINISKQGGDITDVLKIKKDLIDPLEGYDLDDELHQEALVRHMYSMENKSLTSSQIDSLIEADKKDLNLYSKALGFSKKLKNSYKEILRKKKEDLDNERENKINRDKQLRKDLRKAFTDLKLSDNFYEPLVKTVFESNGGLTRVDEDFQKLKEDPKLFAEYLFWRNNPQDFFKKMSEKEIRKRDIKNLELLSLTNKGRGKKEHKREDKTKSNLNDEFFSRIEIKNNK